MPDARKLHDQWTQAEIKQLGQVPDSTLARRIKGAAGFWIVGNNHLHKWTAEEEALLGTAPDSELAARLHRTVTAVQVRRVLLGKPDPAPKYRPWTPEEDALLGTASDTEIAARLGRKIEVVCRRRQKLGIPNLYWQQRCGRQRSWVGQTCSGVIPGKAI